MLGLYKFITARSERALTRYLERRLTRGKENPDRIAERRGEITMARPEGRLLWLHAASVGEAQSALILLQSILRDYPDLQALITTGTRTSAEYLETRLPERCVHQFYPLDHPGWIRRFLDHWKPDLVIWMESELWPNMILEIRARSIPAILMNATMSERSFNRWRWVHKNIKKLLSSFALICAQNAHVASKYKALGAENVETCGNLKYSAASLPYDEGDLNQLRAVTMNRPVWLYAQTHAGEEEVACEVHQVVKNTFPELLTIIVPRHPERGEAVQEMCELKGLDCVRRRQGKRLPDMDTDIYIADTLGELGVFYRLVPIAMIGRSLSADGGGGHNPIEPAQLGCGVLSGPHVHNLQEVFDVMWDQVAALRVENAGKLAVYLQELLSDEAQLELLRSAGRKFAQSQRGVVERVMMAVDPYLEGIGLVKEIK